MTSSKPRILFTENHEDTRDMVVLFLEQAGYEMTTASNVADTLKLAKSGSYNLFILDSWLPNGSAIELCEMLREFDEQTPILFYSALGFEEDKNLAMKAGAQAYLVKPVEISDLRRTVNALIRLERSGLRLKVTKPVTI